VPEEIEKQVDTEAAPSRKPPFKWILIGVAVLVLAGGGYVGWSMVRTETGTPAEPVKTPEGASVTAAEEPDVGQSFEMDPFVVNLNEPGGKRYLKAKIGLEYHGEELRKELPARVPQLRDVILLHLSSKTMEDIQSVDGKIELKNALVNRINQVLKKGKIRSIYFTQFVIQ